MKEVIRLVTGDEPAAEAVAALHRRTGGDPRGVLVELLAALPPEPPAMEERSLPGDARNATFRKEGDFWRLTYDGRSVLIRDAKGLHYLAVLLRAPGTSVHVRDIIPAGGTGVRVGDVERARQAVTKSIQLVIDRLRGSHPELADHLQTSVRRGCFCRYIAAPGSSIAWET